MSKVIKAQREQPKAILPFGFAELQQQKRPSPGQRNLLGGDIASLSFSEPEAVTAVDIQTSVEDLLLNAERKAQELEEEAYRKGYEQGQKDGFEVGQRSMAIVKEHLERLLDTLQGTPETILKEYRDWLIEMCLTLSRHIVRRELTMDRTQLAQLIETLLQEAAEEHTLTVKVHPDDLALLEQHLDLSNLAERTGRTFALRADTQIERGGCRMESDIQVFDASIEKQFSFIEQALRNDEPVADQNIL